MYLLVEISPRGYHPPMLVEISPRGYYPPSTQCFGIDIVYYIYVLLKFTVPSKFHY